MLKNSRPFSPDEIGAAWRRYFVNGTVEYPAQIVAVLCREMGWGYEEYLDQPVEFIHMLLGLMSEEAKDAKRRSE